MAMKLFIIRHASTGEPVPQQSFPDKTQAKDARRALSAQTGEQYVVSPGPDHRRAKAAR